MTHGIVKEQFLTNKSTFRRRRKRHVLKALLFILKCFQNFFPWEKSSFTIFLLI